MRPLTPSFAPVVLRAALAVVALACAGPAAHAEKDDRTKPMSVTSGGDHPDVVDLKKHSAVFTGNVVITQGTRNPRRPRGGEPGSRRQPAGLRLRLVGQAGHVPPKRDGVDEYSEGDAPKIEYDSAANRVRFVGAAHLRMLKGSAVTDTASAALITYDTASETIKLTGDGPAEQRQRRHADHRRRPHHRRLHAQGRRLGTAAPPSLTLPGRSRIGACQMMARLPDPAQVKPGTAVSPSATPVAPAAARLRRAVRPTPAGATQSRLEATGLRSRTARAWWSRKCTWPSTPAKWSACWGPMAPARPPRSI